MTTINDSWTEASFVQTTFKCEVMAKHFPLCFTIHVCLTPLQFPKEFSQPSRTFQLATQEIDGLDTRVGYLVMFSFQSPSWHASRTVDQQRCSSLCHALAGLYTL